MSNWYFPEKPRPSAREAVRMAREKRISAAMNRIAALEREIEVSEMQAAYRSTRP